MKCKLFFLCLLSILLMSFTVLISANMYGDVDNDGEVTVADAVVFMRHLAKWKEYETLENSANADLDSKIEVSIYDGIVLERYLANWKGYETLPYDGNEFDDLSNLRSYAVVKDIESVSFGQYVTFDAYVDGVETTIKVKKIYQKSKDGFDAKRLDKLGKTELQTYSDTVKGIFVYTVDKDGYYILKEEGLKYRLGDYLTVVNGELRFEDFNEVKPVNGWTQRENILRIIPSTKIYIIDTDTNTVKPVEFTIGKEWSIYELTEDSSFYVDKLGYSYSENTNSDRPDYGIAEIVYFCDAPFDGVSISDYKLVFVDSDSAGVLDIEGCGDGYSKFNTATGAYNLSTLKSVKTITVQSEKTSLEAGVYLIDSNNVAIGMKPLSLLADAGEYEIAITNKLSFKYRVMNVSKNGIDLYGYNNIVMTGICNNVAGVKSIKFMDYISNGNSFTTVTESNRALLDHIGDKTVTVLIAANAKSRFYDNVAFPSNTVCGIIIDSLI